MGLANITNNILTDTGVSPTSLISGSGLAGQIAYWTGASTQAGSNNLFWDATNARLGIGTNVPAFKLDVNGTGRFQDRLTILKSESSIFDGVSIQNTNSIGQATTVFRAKNDSTGVCEFGLFSSGTIGASAGVAFFYTNQTILDFYANAGNRMRIYGTGNVLIQNGGTFTDNGNRLQVVGNASVTGNITANGTITSFAGGTDAGGIFYTNNFSVTTSTIFRLNAGVEGGTINSTYALINDFIGLGSLTSATANYLQITSERNPGSPQITATGIINFINLSTRGTSRLGGSSSVTYNAINIDYTINRSGAGIMRGFYYNPTITSLGGSVHNAIETTSGNVLFGSNFFWDNANSRLGIGTNAPAINLDIIQSGGNDTSIRTTSNNDNQLNVRTLGTNNAALISLTSGNGTTSGRFAYFMMSSSETSPQRYDIGLRGNKNLVFFDQTANTERVTVYSSTGNVSLNPGVNSDGGQRLQVYGDAFVRGSADTFATAALTIQNNSGSSLFRVLNNGMLRIGSTSSNPLIFPQTNSGTAETISGTNLSFYSYTGSQSASSGRFFFGGENMTQASGANYNIFSAGKFFPASGTATFADIIINPQISQTGGANGITRGLYVNPTLTAATDWRSIEWSNNTGWGLYGAGTAPNFLGGNTTISYNQNAATNLTISNTTSGTASSVGVIINSSNGGLQIVKYSASTNPYKIILPNDSYIYNNGLGDIAILNDVAAGKIKFAAGASSTAQMTLTAAGRLLLGTTTEGTQRLQVSGNMSVTNPLTASAALATFYGYLNPYQVEASIEVGLEQNNASVAVLGATNIGSNIGGFLQTKNGQRAISFNLDGNVSINQQILSSTYSSLTIGSTNGFLGQIDTNINGLQLHSLAKTIAFVGSSVNPLSYVSFNHFGASTLRSIVLASAYTNAYNVYIEGAPISGTNVTFTNRYALYVNTGTSYFGGNVGIKTTIPYAPSTFSLDVNGGVLIKNTAGTTAQLTLINADPSLGGNEAFIVHTTGGTSTSSFAQLQGYYGTSITGSTALRLNPLGGNVIINSTTNSGEQFQVNGTSRFSNKLSVIATATTNDVALFRSVEPYITIEAVGASNSASLFLNPSTAAQNGTIQNRTGGGLEFYVNANYTTPKMTIKGTTVNINSLPTSSAGLVSGDIWNNGGVLNIV